MEKLLAKVVFKLSKLGVKVTRTFRYPQSTLNLLDLAVPALLQRTPNPVFLQIGASDGVTNDPLRHLVERYKLGGLFVEPLAAPFKKLEENYAGMPGLKFANVAVASTDGQIDLFVPAGANLDIDVSQKASLFADTTMKHFKHRAFEKVSVPGLTVSSLLRKYKMGHVHLLQIDTEGYDFEVIKQIFGSSIFPTVIHFESLHLSREDMNGCRSLLADHNYKYIETTVNTLAIRQ